MLLVLEGPDICSNDLCGARYNAEDSGWIGTCDDCAARAQDHALGLHSDPDAGCRDCR